MRVNQIKLDMASDLDKIKYYIAFSYLNVAPIIKSKIFEYFDYDVIKAWFVDENDLNLIAQTHQITIPKTLLKNIAKIDVEKCYEEVKSHNDVKILTYEDEKYPLLLKEIPDFPLMLYYKGNLEDVDFACPLAVVGSRRATTNAKLALNQIISGFKGTNVAVISGLAYGIDAQAHESAIENNLKTIGVIGCGIDVIYPQQNKKLYEDIENKAGVIFSEYPLGIQPMPQNFPQRNRIVVGMSKGTLVAEAQLKSGAMISANLTLDYNRELMCMPGNITNPNTEGIYHLIKQGAGIVVTAQDIINQLNWDFAPNDNENKNFELNEIQKQVLEIIALEAKSFDEIMSEVSIEVSQLMITLTELEIKGLVIQNNNKYYKA